MKADTDQRQKERKRAAATKRMQRFRKRQDAGINIAHARRTMTTSLRC